MTAPQQWVVQWEDIRVTADDLTAEEVAAVDARTGAGWAWLQSLPGPYLLSNLLAVLMTTRADMSLDAAVKTVAGMSAADLVGCLDTQPIDSTPAQF